MKEILYILLFLFIGFCVYKTFIDEPEVITNTIIDSVFVYQPAETVFVETNLNPFYAVVKQNGYNIPLKNNTIQNLEDSLENVVNSYRMFKESIEKDSVFLRLNNNTAFSTGDSIETEVNIWKEDSLIYNSFKYIFFPRPDKTIYKIETVYKEEWISFAPYGEIYFADKLEYELGILCFGRNNIVFGLGLHKTEGDYGRTIGVSIGKKFDVVKPKFLFKRIL